MRLIIAMTIVLAGVAAMADFEAMAPAVFSTPPESGGSALWADFDTGQVDLRVSGYEDWKQNKASRITVTAMTTAR